MTKVQTFLAIMICLLLSANALADSNCCHIPGRNCQTGNDWVQGYYDGVRGRCQTTAAALSDTTQQSTPTPAPAQTADRSQTGNNCCDSGWQCASGADWTNGYYARQAGDACTAESQASYQHQPSQPSNAKSSSRAAANAQTDSEETDPPSHGTVVEHSDGRVEFIYDDGTSIIVQPPEPPDFSDHREKVCAPLEELGLPCPL